MKQLNQLIISNAINSLIYIVIIIDHQQRVQENCDDAKSFREYVLKKTRDKQTYFSFYRVIELINY